MKTIIYILISWIIIYAMISFSLLNVNPLSWDVPVRLLLSILFLISAFAIYFLRVLFKDEI